MMMDYQDLQKIQKESTEQVLPQQKKVLSASDKIRRKTSNLPDPTHPPMGWKDGKGYDHIFPWIHLPRLHPKNHGDTIIFNDPKAPANQIILGDNLEVLRTLPTESIDLIYIDPPFFSGRNYNVIWGDTNEVRSFYDIWEGGIDSYLVWLNARLWEMRRVLKKTGSIYVHCDWHASHYIKTEMDKIFGYYNFLNEIIWEQDAGQRTNAYFPRKHDILLLYAKNINEGYIFNWWAKEVRDEYNAIALSMHFKKSDEFGPYREYLNGKKFYKKLGKMLADVWSGISSQEASSPIMGQTIGYPTQKPETLLERVIQVSSDSIDSKVFKLGLEKYLELGIRKYANFGKLPTTKQDAIKHNLTNLYLLRDHSEWTRKVESKTIEPDIVADFFVGGGTTVAVAQRLKRYFVASDISRVAISVALDRLVKIGEEMSGIKSNIYKAAGGQEKLELSREKVPNIEVSYLGVYPAEKFASISQDEFVDFVLTCYGASKNTTEGKAHGFRPPGQSEPILVGPSDPQKSISGKEIKAFFDEIKSRLEPNKLVSAKIIGWRFDRQIVEYIKILAGYIEKHTLPLKIDLIPLDSKEFRARVLQRYPDVEAAEFFLRFSKAPVIGDIRVKKIKDLEYEFEAIDAISTNEDGWLVNCQWDFDYQEGHFAADKDYVLSREKVTDKKKGERFKATLKAKHTFEKSGEVTIACKVQDNLAGEIIFSKKISISL